MKRILHFTEGNKNMQGVSAKAFKARLDKRQKTVPHEPRTDNHAMSVAPENNGAVNQERYAVSSTR